MNFGLNKLIHKNVFIFVILLSSFSSLRGQVVLSGVASDSATSKGIDYLQVVLYEMSTKKLVDYTFSKEDGSFSLALKEGVYELKTQSLIYHSISMPLVLLNPTEDTIRIRLSLREKVGELEEITITDKKPGVIYKQDTVIYDVASWARQGDKSLEETMSRMPGLKISADGEIEFEGIAVNHVLIDGKKVSDVGNAILSKTLQSGQVESIEIRKKEKNDNLKASMLDNRDIMVLDIKLKKGVSKDFFGSGTASTSYDDKARLGGYATVFSLHEKVNIHLLGETSQFGQQIIKLSSIKRLGREEFQKIFEIPADYQRLTEKEEFNSEIYGFDNYIFKSARVGALSVLYQPTEKTTIFMGSYISDEYLEVSQTNRLDFSEGGNSVFSDRTIPNNLTWKNKFDVLHQAKSFRLNYSLNFISDYQNFFRQTNIDNSFREQTNEMSKYEWYHRATAEFKISEKLGFSINALYNDNNYDSDNLLIHSDSVYGKYFEDDNFYGNIEQQIVEEKRGGYFDTKLAYSTASFSYFVGFRFFDESYDYSKMGTSSLLSAENQINYRKAEPYLKVEGQVGSLWMSHTVGYGFMDFNANQGETIHQDLLTLNSEINTDIGSFLSVSLGYKRQISAYPFRNATEGMEFIDFQRFAFPQNQLVEPTPETSINATLTFRMLEKWNISTTLAQIYGKTYNSPTFRASDVGFTNIAYSQNPSDYSFTVLKFEKRQANAKLNGDVEIGYLNSSQANNIDGGEESVTSRVLLNAALNSSFEESIYDFTMLHSLRNYSFYFEDKASKTQQNIYMLTFSNIFRTKNKKNTLVLSAKYANMRGENSSSENKVIDAKFEKFHKSISAFFLVSNLLDSQTFVSESIFPTYKLTSTNAMLGRFFQLGFSFQFK